MFFLNSPEPSIIHASTEERYEAIERLIAPATLRRGYYLLLTLSVSIITAGLLADNPSVIIGGMVMAPLLLPILSLSLSIVTRSWKGMLQSARVLFYSLVLTFILSYGISWVMEQTPFNVTWIPDAITPELYIFIAICSGIAAAFAWVKEDFAPSIAGIAIAVSLLPPLCAVGIASAHVDLMLAQNSLLLFLLNLAGIIAGATTVFILLGFTRSGKQQEKIIKSQSK